MKLQTEGVLQIESIEDAKQAIICETFQLETENSNDEDGIGIAIRSWDTTKQHTDIYKLIGRKIKITIEVID